MSEITTLTSSQNALIAQFAKEAFSGEIIEFFTGSSSAAGIKYYALIIDIELGQGGRGIKIKLLPHRNVTLYVKMYQFIRFLATFYQQHANSEQRAYLTKLLPNTQLKTMSVQSWFDGYFWTNTVLASESLRVKATARMYCVGTFSDWCKFALMKK